MQKSLYDTIIKKEIQTNKFSFIKLNRKTKGLKENVSIGNVKKRE